MAGGPRRHPRGGHWRRAARATGAVMIAALLSACAAFNPPPLSREQRLASFPVSGHDLSAPVMIRWNAYQVPFVTAQSDRDLAYALGLVHGHLRLAQIHILKRVSQGRISEMAGPFARDFDLGIRTLGFGRASPEIVARMPAETRALMQAFVDGLNAYQRQLKRNPPEFGLLGLEREAFTIEDMITIGRLAGSDVNWFAYLSLLPQRGNPDWAEVWQRALETGRGPTLSFPNPGLQAAVDVLMGLSRSGSNALVVAPGKSASGGALIASDPHLGTSVPNAWLLAGVKSPSFHAVGFMIPGLPFVALGRSPDLAWGGTHMRAANSDLYDVSGRDPAEIVASETTIGTRFWFDAERTIRTSRFGPIMSDTPFVQGQPGEVLALRWIGHEPSDEVSALFAVMRARTALEFRAALANFAVSPQNFLCADTQGNICHALATRLPKRPYRTPPDLVLDATDPAMDWPGIADARELPFALNPPEGFLASANNRPTDAVWPIGYFFNADERIRRLQELLAEDASISLADLKRLQLDVVSLDARSLSAALVQRIEALQAARAADPAFLARLKGFDGAYLAEASGPVAFETLLYHLVPLAYGYARTEDVPSARQQFAVLAARLPGDLDGLGAPERDRVLSTAIARAARDAARYSTWGDMHRLQVQHWIAAAPLIGGAFVYGDYPAPGSRETIHKTAHGLVNTRSGTRYGSQARHVSDMGDMDANYFVLLGGNDGWLGSINLLDQVPLWRAGEYIRMPLRPQTVASEFPDVLTLTP